MPNKLTQQEFIDRSKKLFDNINYNKVNYIGCHVFVVLTCTLHGDWKEKPNRHINQKMGCPICRGAKNNTQTFIEKSKLINGDRYEYSKTVFVKNETKVIITCKIHGDFEQSPNQHLSKAGCAQCSHNPRRDLNYFLTEARAIHKNRYDYSLVNYTTMDEKVSIICSTHRVFWQTPSKHINGKQNCPKCDISATKDVDYFLNKSKLVHKDKYDYSLVNYSRMNVKVDIVCPKHGVFSQTPQAHTSGEYGCLKCSCKVSKAEIEWLDSLSLPNDKEHRSVVFLHLKRRLIVDGFDPATNTVYEFNGDYFHGNPKIYPPEQMNKTVGRTHGELYQRTLSKETMLKEAGYNLISIWESDWNKIKNESG